MWAEMWAKMWAKNERKKKMRWNCHSLYYLYIVFFTQCHSWHTILENTPKILDKRGGVSSQSYWRRILKCRNFKMKVRPPYSMKK